MINYIELSNIYKYKTPLIVREVKAILDYIIIIYNLFNINLRKRYDTSFYIITFDLLVNIFCSIPI